MSSKKPKACETIRKSFPWGDFRTLSSQKKNVQTFFATFSKVSPGTCYREVLTFTYD